MKFKLLLIGALMHVSASGFNRADEPYLPFQARMTEAFHSDDGAHSVNSGESFVLIRPEGDHVVADFSRKGVFTVPIEKTNVAEEVARLKQASGSQPIIPRMALFLANRILSAESEWMYPLRSERVNQYTQWYLLYGIAQDADTISAIEVSDAFYRRLPEDVRGKTAFVYMDVPGDKQGIQQLYDDLKPGIQAMPGYLSKGYSKSLAHVDSMESLPVLVELRSSGAIIEQHVGIDAIREALMHP